MTSWSGRVVYIDGFAGPGIYSGGEEGSPIIALKEAVQHSAKIKAQMVFLFIEANPDRHVILEEQVASITLPPNITVRCLRGRFDEKLTEVLDYLTEQKKHLAPTFAFIDPFGFSHTPFSLVKRLMQNKGCEVLITFMYEEINRFLNHPDQPENYDALFGYTHWRNAIQMQGTQERKQYLHDLYRDQLNKEAGIDHVRSFEMINRGNRTDYFLFFGTKNIEGLKKMKAVMWKADEAGNFAFSDTTNMNQQLLFESNPDYGALKAQLVSKFQGKVVPVGLIEKFVLTETPFRETHYKIPVLKPMELAHPPELHVITRPGQNRKGTFPPGTMIKIL